MRTAILYTPSNPDNFYIIIAKANEMTADTTQFRTAAESAAIAGFNFYVVTEMDLPGGINTLECWYVDTFERNWKFVTTEEHHRFKEIERI